MTTRYVLAPEAALDLVEIWQYIKEQSSLGKKRSICPTSSPLPRHSMNAGWSLAVTKRRRSARASRNKPRRLLVFGLQLRRSLFQGDRRVRGFWCIDLRFLNDLLSGNVSTVNAPVRIIVWAKRAAFQRHARKHTARANSSAFPPAWSHLYPPPPRDLWGRPQSKHPRPVLLCCAKDCPPRGCS